MHELCAQRAQSGPLPRRDMTAVLALSSRPAARADPAEEAGVAVLLDTATVDCAHRALMLHSLLTSASAPHDIRLHGRPETIHARLEYWQLSDDVGVLNAPRALVAWPTAPARDTIFRVAREHGLRIWTWRPWSLYTEFPTTSLVAHRLSFTDRLRGLRARRPDP